MYKIYIKNKKEENFNKDVEEDVDYKKLHTLAKDLIVSAHNFIREKNDISSVSLRDIDRFKIFYEFFFDYLMKKKEVDLEQLENKQLDNEEFKLYKNLNEYELHKYSIILAVYICYYLHLSDNETRKKLVQELNKILKNFDKSSEDFLYLPIKEANYIIKNIVLPKGIAKNKALLDIIFSLFIFANYL